MKRIWKPLDLPVTPLPDEGPLRLVLHFAKMFRWQLVVVCILAMLSSALGLAGIWAIAFVVDGVTDLGAEIFLQQHSWLLIGFFVLFVLVDPLAFLLRQTYAFQTVRILLPAAMRWQAHKAVETQDLAFFEDTFAGQVASRIAQVTMSVHRQMMLAIETIPRLFVQFGGSFLLLLAMAWPLAVPVIVWIVANIIVAWLAIPSYMQRSARVAAANSGNRRYDRCLFQYCHGEALRCRRFRSWGHTQGNRRDHRHTAQREPLLYSDRQQRLFSQRPPDPGCCGYRVQRIDGWLGDDRRIRRRPDSHTVAVDCLVQFHRRWPVDHQHARHYQGRHADYDQPAGNHGSEGATELQVTNGQIHFENVSFSYQKDRRPVLETFNLSISPGERVGLVGLSGAGKSTVISLLMRLRDVSEGRITIDGQDIREVTQASLRSQIGVVTQDISLLNRSLRDNIRYGKPDATDAEIRAITKAADALEFIEEQRDSQGREGLDAHVGDRGVKLSGDSVSASPLPGSCSRMHRS